MSIRFLAALFLAALPSVSIAADPPAVRFEFRVVTVPADLQFANGPSKEGEAVFLKDADLKFLLETAQGNRRTNIMQAPRVTANHDEAVAVRAVETQTLHTTLEAAVVNGQSVLIPKKASLETGMTLNLRGRVSADKTAVAVDVKYSDKRVEKVNMVPVTTMITPVFEGGSQGKPVPFKYFLEAPQITTIAIEKKDLRLPSGGHVAIAGPSVQTEVREESRVPVLGDLPFAGRLFRTVGIAKVNVRRILILTAQVFAE